AGLAEPGAVEARASDPLPAPAPHFSRTTLETTVSGEGEGPYKFTASWHTRRANRWATLLEPYGGRKGLNYLEIGVFEGRSLLWMFDHVLTDVSSRATVVDPFFDDYEVNYDHNIAASSVGKRVRKIKALSENGLRELAADSFDIIYVDGSHTADDVLVDAVLSWDLLREGGLIIFDDYRWGGRPKGNPIPPELRPAVAVDAFITAHRYEIEIVERGAQVWLKKKRNPCGVKDYCTPYRDHLYLWREYALRDAEGETVPLTPEEIRVLERLLGSARFGEVKIRLNREIRKDPVYLSLKAKLDGKP
ncbi:MAG: class I SAM-dependent methyltransferase, partial [Nannocystaceae bacterium]|nr:class I SAM-dependent methyltransferase [Nannocystaceae bacterium]